YLLQAEFVVTVTHAQSNHFEYTVNEDFLLYFVYISIYIPCVTYTINITMTMDNYMWRTLAAVHIKLGYPKIDIKGLSCITIDKVRPTIRNSRGGKVCWRNGEA